MGEFHFNRRQIHWMFCLFFVVSILLNGCESVIATDEIEPHREASDLKQSTTSIRSTTSPSSKPTTIETLAPPVIPTSTPPFSANLYRLKSWSEEDALSALEEAQSLAKADYSVGGQRYFITLLNEYLERFPESLKKNPWIDELIRQSMAVSIIDKWFLGTPLPHSLEPLRARLEKALNDGELKTENIQTFLQNYAIHVYNDPIRTNNLFGDNQAVDVYNLSGWDDGIQAILFIKGSHPGDYQVSAFSGDVWELTYRQYYQISIQDLNHNEIPEIVKKQIFWSHGTGNYFSRLFIYEWDGNEFVNLAVNVKDNFVQADNADFEDWSFIGKENSASVIRANIVLPLSERCSLYSYHINYEWNGKAFIEKETFSDPLPKDSQPYCSILWAKQAGFLSEDALRIIKENVSTWPQELNGNWGPASEDYFRLWLAIDYAARGNDIQSIELLDNIIKNSSNTTPNIIPSFASYFLNSYKADGSIMACEDLSRLMLKERDAALGYPSGYSDTDWQILLKTWGFGSSDFSYQPICNIQEITQMELGKQTFHHSVDIINWLSDTGLTGEILEKGDFNQDGLQDWIISLPLTGKYGRLETYLWVVFQQKDSVLPVLIWNGFDNNHFSNTITKLPFSESLSPAYFYHNNTNAFTFHFANIGQQWAPVINEIDNPFISDIYSIEGTSLVDKGVIVSYKIEPMPGDISNQSTIHPIKYDWNSTSILFDKEENNTEHLSQQLTMVEKYLFDQNKPTEAINILKTTLKDDLTTQASLEYTPEEYQLTSSYLYYLLGYAYEKTGDTQNAVQIYGQLWKSYPYSPYALIAQRKLEFIN